ncbi:Protein NRT1/ PTR FAMILY 8.1 [Linum perenne]
MTNLVQNGRVDFRGRVADKNLTGGWKGAPFIIVNEVAERLAFFAIAVNMVTYLVLEMRQTLPTAVTHVTDWIGAAYVLTFLGAFLADAYLGRFRTIMIFSCVYSVGMVMLTVSASVDGLRPPPCTARPCPKATEGQTAFLYCALALIALGTGGIKPCVSSFGAEQFDESDPGEEMKKYAFFNWFFFAINMGALLGITLLVYLQIKEGWAWGFGVPTAAMLLSVVILATGFRFYRFQKPMGSPFTRFFDKAAIVTDAEVDSRNRWKLCTITQVEEFKSFIRVLPVWASTIALSISFAQLSTFFVSQAAIMHRKLGGSNFEIPSASVPVFSVINALFLVPLYEKLIVPSLRKRTGHPRGLTSLQRMGVGLFISVFSTLSAAIVEKRRRESPDRANMSIFWLFPQFFLLGSAEVFTYVGQLEFFYDEATDGTRSISSAMFLAEIGIGSWLSTAIVKIIGSATGGEERGWLRNKLNESKLDYFYWVLTVINVVNFMVYLVVALRYKGKASVATVRDEVAWEGGHDVRMVDMVVDHSVDLKSIVL